MMRARGLVLAAGALLGLSSAAMAQFTATSPGPHDSNGPAGSPANGFFTYNYLGADFQVGNVIFSGTATSTGIGSYRSELRYRIMTPTGGIFDSGQLATGTTWVGPEAVNNTSSASALGLQGAGMWTFSFWESFDDGGLAGVDAIWTDVSFQLLVGVPPPPPVPTFSGSFASTPHVLVNGVAMNGTTIWDGTQVGLTRGAGENSLGTRYAGSSFDHLGNEMGFRIDHGGGDLQVNLTGLGSDLDLILLDSSGTPAGALLRSENGGTTAEQVLLANAAPGVYYAVVDTFGGTNQGSDFTITYIPSPGSIALIGLGGLLATRRRR